MERSPGQIVREAKIERERERGERRVERKVRHMDERERKKKRDKMTERKEKIIKKLIFPYNIFGHTVPTLVFGVPNTKYLAFGTSDGNTFIPQLLPP